MQTHPNNQPDTWSVYTCVLCLILFFVCILSGIEKLWANTHCDQAISMAQDGDLIFIDLPNPIFKQVAVSTQSWTSHLGLLLRADNGDWLVAEELFEKVGDRLKGSGLFDLFLTVYHHPILKFNTI
jgi:hypothetical protein